MCDTFLMEPAYNYQEEELEPVPGAFDSVMSTSDRKSPSKLGCLLDS